MVVHQYYYRDPRVQRYAEALADANVAVDVLALRSPDQPTEARDDGIRVFTIPLGRGYKKRFSYLVEYILGFLLFAIWLVRLHMQNHYQIIHVHNMPDFLVFAAAIPRLFGARVVLDIHDPMPEVYASKYGIKNNSLMMHLLRWQERMSAAFADAVITANHNFREHLMQRGVPAGKITVVNNVADAYIFNRQAYERLRHRTNETFTLIYPGTIARRYGLDLAIRALPLLVEHIPHIRLKIMGTYVDYVDELRQLAEHLGVVAHVEFHRAVPVHDVPAHMIQADVGMYLAYADIHMNTATPTKVLEFAAMGIPVVASRLAVLEDLFSDAAMLFFEPGNVEAFACQVRALYDSPARRAELVRHSDEEYVSRYTWAAERRTYFGVLNSLLAVRLVGACRD
jgi:glycosyltransferase involved in cell wall biosynthesis